jgi:hypothetical protein
VYHDTDQVQKLSRLQSSCVQLNEKFRHVWLREVPQIMYNNLFIVHLELNPKEPKEVE